MFTNFSKNIIFSGLIFFPIPLIVLFGLSNFHLFVSILYSLTASIIILETLAGIPKNKDYSKSKFKSVTALIPAYLPNEPFLLETVRAVRLSGFSEIIIASNTNKPTKIEEELKKLKDVTLLIVPGSTSKAENLNFALINNYVSNEYVAIFDADHHPQAGSLEKAIHWFNSGYDAVQGRCIIRKPKNWIQKVIAAEFDSVYRLLHSSRFNLTKTAIFGGSNCYWKTEVLKNFSFNKVLTEDIDLSLRALSTGVKIAHDPNILSTELAPSTISDLWKQRLRWSQGWLQVTLKLSKKLLGSSSLSLRAKSYWFYNLIYRELFSALAFSILFILAGYWVTGHQSDSIYGNFYWASTSLCILSILLNLGVTYFTSNFDNYRTPLKYNIIFVLPFTMLKSLITLMAWSSELVGIKEWRVTSRD